MDYALTTTVARPFAEVLEETRGALADQGFGVLTEIDMAATLKARTGAEIPDQVILGACRPQLAHQALEADPRVAALLPCNVVVTDSGDGNTLVEALDPGVMPQYTGSDSLNPVAAEARELLSKMLDALGGTR